MTQPVANRHLVTVNEPERVLMRVEAVSGSGKAPGGDVRKSAKPDEFAGQQADGRGGWRAALW